MVVVTPENRLEIQRSIEDRLRPLMGEYFLFKFGGNWYEPRFNTALTLLQLKPEGFTNLYHPGDYVDYGFPDDTQDRACLKYMLEHGIKKVYTMNSPPKNIPVFGKILDYLTRDDTNIKPEELAKIVEGIDSEGFDINAYSYHNLYEQGLSGLGVKEIKEAGIEIVSLFRFGQN